MGESRKSAKAEPELEAEADVDEDRAEREDHSPRTGLLEVSADHRADFID